MTFRTCDFATDRPIVSCQEIF